MNVPAFEMMCRLVVQIGRANPGMIFPDGGGREWVVAFAGLLADLGKPRGVSINQLADGLQKIEARRGRGRPRVEDGELLRKNQRAASLFRDGATVRDVVSGLRIGRAKAVRIRRLALAEAA